MMTSSRADRDIKDIEPLRHREAITLAETEYRRFASLLAQLSDADWAAPTECVPWTVRDMSTHVLGWMRASSSVREQARQVRAAKRRGGSVADAMSALQVEELADLRPAAIRTEVGDRIATATRGRRMTPWPVRHWVRITAQLPVACVAEKWPIGYLVDVIGTRDTWMHRMDICRATGHEPELAPEHDGRVVADIVAEWARRHGRPFQLVLTGPAGGTYRSGPAAAPETYDAVAFCRALSGRDGTLPFGTEVPF